ncbi:hypothetical protein ACFQY8_07465 [Alloscardovia venturai]|uniref:Uncharacterized protein n=1 Tax=Alloscardovia venturai TaxID=1769421 RepID=A0ABW2Y5N7_9BIFI
MRGNRSPYTHKLLCSKEDNTREIVGKESHGEKKTHSNQILSATTSWISIVSAVVAVIPAVTESSKNLQIMESFFVPLQVLGDDNRLLRIFSFVYMLANVVLTLVSFYILLSDKYGKQRWVLKGKSIWGYAFMPLIAVLISSLYNVKLLIADWELWLFLDGVAVTIAGIDVLFLHHLLFVSVGGGVKNHEKKFTRVKPRTKERVTRKPKIKTTLNACIALAIILVSFLVTQYSSMDNPVFDVEWVKAEYKDAELPQLSGRENSQRKEMGSNEFRMLRLLPNGKALLVPLHAQKDKDGITKWCPLKGEFRLEDPEKLTFEYGKYANYESSCKS